MQPGVKPGPRFHLDPNDGENKTEADVKTGTPHIPLPPQPQKRHMFVIYFYDLPSRIQSLKGPI